MGTDWSLPLLPPVSLRRWICTDNQGKAQKEPRPQRGLEALDPAVTAVLVVSVPGSQLYSVQYSYAELFIALREIKEESLSKL